MANALSRRFRQFVEQKQLFSPGNKILLAVSGGVDSIVMAHLFAHCRYRFAIAHCNFQLRGVDSEEDERFVRDLALSLKVPFFSKSFDTLTYAAEKGISIQMAARELRYTWFRDVLELEGYGYLATAHHKDDVAETILLNLVKGSVWQGLQGIPVKAGHVVRPLLFAAKEELLQYAKEYKLPFREDASNHSNKYQRNLIRNEVMPLLKEINPDLVETISSRTAIREELWDWMNFHLEVFYQRVFKEKGSHIESAVSDLRKLNSAVLFAVLNHLGFTYEQFQGLMNSLYETETKVFMSSTHRMVKEREKVIIEPLTETIQIGEVLFAPEDEFSFAGAIYKAEVISLQEVQDKLRPEIALLDAGKLNFPLRMRLWQSGDFFIPLGMKGKKKISDLLTDAKASLREKEQQAVVLSGNDIVWVVGRRIDERYKIDENTRQVLLLAAK